MAGEISKQNKENILRVDNHISKQVYKGGNRLPNFGELLNYFSRGTLDWDRMSTKEKFAYGALIVSAVAGIGIAAEYGLYKGEHVKSVKEKYFSKSSSRAVVGAPAVVANESAVATPTPQPDYYDPDFKVGIVIEGDDGFKRNVTNLIETFKQVTPDDYKDLIKYAPKKIVRSPDRFNWYGGAPNDDVIEVTEVTEKYGGSNDSGKRLFGVVDIVPELENAKLSKTGVPFNTVYERELEINKRKAEYAIKVGVMSKEGADDYIKYISEQLKTGRYFDGAKLNQSH